MRLVIIVGLLCVASIAPSPARAQDAEEQDARALFERGRTAYQRELYTEAEDAFVAAYEAMSADDPRRPLILLNVAQAIERQGGRDDDALTAWQRFRRDAASVASPEYLQRADARIRELSARAERRRIAAERNEEPAEPEGGAVVAPEPDAGTFNPHWSGIVVLAVGGAALLAGAAVGLFGLTERGAVLDACEGTRCPEHVRQRAADLQTWGVVADALLWPGVALAAAGALMMLFIPNEARHDTITASCGLGGCALQGRW